MIKRILRYGAVLAVLWVIHLQRTTVELKLLAAMGSTQAQQELVMRSKEDAEDQSAEADCYWECRAGKIYPVQKGGCLMPPEPVNFCKKYIDKQ